MRASRWLVVVALLALGLSVQSAWAQVQPPPAGVPPGQNPNERTVNIYGPGQLGSTSGIPTRMDRSRREMNRGRPDTAIMDSLPEEPAAIIDAAQTALNRARKRCRVVEAVVLGRDTDNAPVFEAACERGPGYLVVAGTPPRAVECAEAAEGTGHRDRDPDADVVNECQLAGNGMTLERIADYARRAGVACEIDEGQVVGRHNAGTVIEIGCRSSAGYWLTRKDGAWQRIPCFKVAGEDGVCRFTTAEETADALSARLAGTSAADCRIEETRYVGKAGDRDYLEAACSGGQGYMLEIGEEERVTNAWSCDRAATIAGGCQLRTGRSEG